jgi:hypothetical protein
LIIAIVGDVGSGKSLAMARNISMHRKKVAFVNFQTHELDNCFRLKKTDIVIQDGKKCFVNWDFWKLTMKKFKDFDIYLDEIHNLFPHRRGMTNYSVEGLKWLAQIRKILGQSEKNNLYICSQVIEHIDASWRRLLHGIIYCEKMTKQGRDNVERVYIKLYTFIKKHGVTAEKRFSAFVGGMRSWNYPVRFFCGNAYFKYYDSYGLVMGEDVWL